MHDPNSRNPTGRPGGVAATHPGQGRPAAEASSLIQDFKVDVNEKGAPKDGQPQEMNRRLFMQLLVFRCSGAEPSALIEELGRALGEGKIPAVIYEDVNDPWGIGVLTFSEDPEHFVKNVRPIVARVGAGRLTLRPEMGMLGRTYSSGYEADLEYWILRRPVETALNTEWPWVVWYPLRRSGAFAKLSGREQASILKEHAIIGRRYGEKDLAHDIRLACHGLDANDSDFVIGLLGRDLHPLSHVVQTMRRTRQTSEYIVQMGPFFVGKAAYQGS